MTERDKLKQHGKSTVTVTEATLKSEAKSLKVNPAGETVCSPYFSRGCINEDTNLPTTIKEEIEHEKH